MKTSTRKSMPKARRPESTERLLARVDAKTRQIFDRQHEACRTKLPPEICQRWDRLARLMVGLASALPKSSGSNAMLFFIPDGPYRKQVFALHARKDGALLVYMPDILDQAVKAGLLQRPGRTSSDNIYRIGGGESLEVEVLDGKSPNQDTFYKDLTGWNRRAMCIILPVSATAPQLQAVEGLCTLAAAAWQPPAD
jgi:hypothetical protein